MKKINRIKVILVLTWAKIEIMQYIAPDIRFTYELKHSKESYLGIFNNKDEKTMANYMNSIFESKLVFVMSKPGMGKTRFLQELFNHAEEFQKEACFLDLKYFRNELIDTIAHLQNIRQANNVHYQQTGGFDLNDEKNKLICLDALDECPRDVQLRILNEILAFKSTNSKDTIVISCREAIAGYHEIDIKNLNALFAYIQPFHEGNVISMLTANHFTNEQTRMVWNKFSHGWKMEGITSPRDVKAFIELSNKFGFDTIINKSFVEIYDALVDKRLADEEQKSGINHKPITKRLLEKLALTMETLEINSLSTDDLMTFFEEIDSSIGSSFLQQVSLDQLYERALIDFDKTTGTIQFDNREIQEYLAAKSITRFSNPKQGAFDLVFDLELQEFRPTWSNTIKFLCSINPELILPFVDFISKRKNDLDFDILTVVISADFGNPGPLTHDQKNEIFSKTILHYTNSNKYRDYFIDRNLSNFFSGEISNSFLRQLLDEQGKKVEPLQPSTYRLLEYIVRKHPNLDNDYWKNTARTVAISNSERSIVRTTALSFLGKINDFNFLVSIENKVNELDRTTQEAWYRALHEADPNELFGIKKIIGAERDKMFSYFPHPNPLHVTSKKGVMNCLDVIINDSEFKDALAHESHYTIEDISQFARKCNEFWDSEIANKIISLLDSIKDSYIQFDLKSFYEIYRTKSSLYTIDFAIKNHDRLDYYASHLFHLLTPEATEIIVDYFEKNGLDKSKLAEPLYWFNNNNDDNRSKAIQELTEEHFKEEFQRINERMEISKKRAHNQAFNNKIYLQFLNMLNLEKVGVYHSNVFIFFNDHKSTIDKQWTEKVENIFFDAVDHALSQDVSTFTISRNETSKNSFQLNIPPPVFALNYALSSAKLLGIDINKYRSTIIKAFPLLLDNDLAINRIDELLPFTVEEINWLVAYYNKNSDNSTLEVASVNLKSFIERFQPKELMPLLKKIVVNPDFETHRRSEFLHLIQKIEPDYQFYKSTFDSIDDVNDQIKILCNELLIENSASFRKVSIQWRMGQIKNRVKQYGPNPVGSRNYDMPELGEGRLNLVLAKVNDKSYLNDYLDLLQFSIELYSHGEDFHAYCDYIWKVAFVYFVNIAQYKSILPLNEVERILKGSKAFDESYLLKNHHINTRRHYVREIAKPENITAATHKVNNLKNKTYLRLSSAEELKELIKTIINEDLRNWIENEGAYSFIIEAKRKQEDLIQKTAKSELQKALLKRGFRWEEIQFIREEQLLDNKRIDFSIIHGFVGKVFVEIKRTDNNEITNKVKRAHYQYKMLQYLKGSHSDYGIYLVLQVKDSYPLSKYQKELAELYKDTNIEIIGINCLETSS
ncbi:hypothetical protein GC194_11065 [bacterium]|nr:hypothetical protein [bacterium]